MSATSVTLAKSSAEATEALLTANSILLSVLLVLASALCAVGIWALTEVVRTSRSARTLADDLDARMVPLLDKADITVDAINAELLRVDTIVTRIEEITERVDNTSRTVQDVANAPGEIVNDIAGRVRRAWRNRAAQASAASAERAAESGMREAAGEAGSEAPPQPPRQGEDPASEAPQGADTGDAQSTSI